MTNTFYLSDYGLDITIIVTETDANGDQQARDISAATGTDFLFEKQDGTEVTKAASFTTDGSDGSIYYTIESGFLDVTGNWSVRAKITEPTPADYKTAKVQFTVEE